MSRTPRVVGNAKRTGQFAGDSTNDIAEEFKEEVFWAVATDAIAVGEIVTRTPGNFRNVSRAAGGAAGALQIVCGVALTATTTAGQQIKILRRGVHPAVVLATAGGAGASGSIILLAAIPDFGQGVPASVATAFPTHWVVGMQLETGTGAGPFVASVYVSTRF